jgi:hypothetical protein
MNAKYDFPQADGLEIVLTAVVDGSSATGTWTAREKAGGSEVATGGWKVTKE